MTFNTPLDEGLQRRARQICHNKYQLLGKDPVVHHRSWFGYRASKSLLLAVVVSLVLVTGSLLGPLWAGENQQVLRQVPGSSPRQTIDNFLATTEEAQNLIQGAIREGLATSGWFYSPA